MANNSTEYFAFLLNTLRREGLGWIADEVQSEIASGGPLVEKEWREPGRWRRKETGLTVAEYSDEERLEIALRIIWERAAVGHALWIDTKEVLGSAVRAADVTFVDDDDDGRSYFPFSQDFPAALAKLHEVLQGVARECRLEGPDVNRLATEPGRSFAKADATSFQQKPDGR